MPGDAHGEESVGKYISVRIFGSEGCLTYEGDDQRPESGSLELSRRASHAGRERLYDTFHFENYDNSEGSTGPESLCAFIDACRGREAFVGAGPFEGLQVVCALEAMYRSAASGRAEAVSEAE